MLMTTKKQVALTCSVLGCVRPRFPKSRVVEFSNDQARRYQTCVYCRFELWHSDPLYLPRVRLPNPSMLFILPWWRPPTKATPPPPPPRSTSSGTDTVTVNWKGSPSGILDLTRDEFSSHKRYWHPFSLCCSSLHEFAYVPLECDFMLHYLPSVYRGRRVYFCSLSLLFFSAVTCFFFLNNLFMREEK